MSNLSRKKHITKIKINNRNGNCITYAHRTGVHSAKAVRGQYVLMRKKT